MDIRRFLKRPISSCKASTTEEPPTEPNLTNQQPSECEVADTQTSSSGLAGPANINPTAGRPPVPGPSVGHDDLGEKHSCPKQPTLSKFPSKIIGKTKR